MPPGATTPTLFLRSWTPARCAIRRATKPQPVPLRLAVVGWNGRDMWSSPENGLPSFGPVNHISIALPAINHPGWNVPLRACGCLTRRTKSDECHQLGTLLDPPGKDDEQGCIHQKLRMPFLTKGHLSGNREMAQNPLPCRCQVVFRCSQVERYRIEQRREFCMTTIPPVRSPLKWIGGKFAAAPRIVAAFPPSTTYDTYLEPCGGAAHVLMYKPQWGHREVYNDLNDDLYNFWLQVQNNADALVQQLQVLPYSRALYYTYYARLFDGSEIDPFERAVMWFYVLRSTPTGWLRESAVGWNNSLSNAASYRSILEAFGQIQERLTCPRVILDNRDVERAIQLDPIWQELEPVMERMGRRRRGRPLRVFSTYRLSFMNCTLKDIARSMY